MTIYIVLIVKFLFIVIIALCSICQSTDISLLNGIYEKYENIEFVFQVPSTKKPSSRDIKGIVFLAHGCSHRATDFWPTTSTCQQCIGLPVERMIVTDVLHENMIAIAISSSNTEYKCWGNPDKVNVAKVLKYFHEKYILKMNTKPPLPLYLFGASSGGHFVGMFSQIAQKNMNIHVAGTIIQISTLSTPRDTASTTTNSNHMKSIIAPIVFIHMPKDTYTATQISEKINELNQANLPAIEYPIETKRMTSDYFTYANVLSLKDSKLLVKELMRAGYLNRDGYLLSDPRESNWREVARKALPHITPSIDTLIANQSGISELLNVAWASHEITQESFVEALRWFKKSSNSFSNKSQCSLSSSLSSSINSNSNSNNINSTTAAIFYDISCSSNPENTNT